MTDDAMDVVERLRAMVAQARESVEDRRDRLQSEISAAVLNCGNADPFRVADSERREADRLDVWLKAAEANQ